MVHWCLHVRNLEFSTVAKDALRSRWGHFKTKRVVEFLAVPDTSSLPPHICLLFLLLPVPYFLPFSPLPICLQFHIVLLLHVSILSDHICLLRLSLLSLPFSPLLPTNTQTNMHTILLLLGKSLPFLLMSPSLRSGLVTTVSHSEGHGLGNCLNLLSQDFLLRCLPWSRELS